jgi:hypothetical protein
MNRRFGGTNRLHLQVRKIRQDTSVQQVDTQNSAISTILLGYAAVCIMLEPNFQRNVSFLLQGENIRWER